MKLTSILLLCLLSTAAFAQNASFTRNNSHTGSVPSKTVSGLPTCNAAATGNIILVTDALTPAVAVAVVGGGAVQTLTHCNGTNWIVG